MPRKPLGTYVRTLADWAYPNSVSAGCSPPKIEGDNTSFCEVSLYNDQAQGWLLQLDAINVNPAGDAFEGYHVQGVDGALYAPEGGDAKGVRIYSGQAAQPGAIYTYTMGAQPPLTVTANLAIGRYPGTTQTYPDDPAVDWFVPLVHIETRGPLAIIKPGYSFAILFIPSSGFNPYVTFWWTAINGT